MYMANEKRKSSEEEDGFFGMAQQNDDEDYTENGDDDEDDEAIEISPSRLTANELEFGRLFSYEGSSTETKILASLLPDEIIFNIDCYEPRTFDSVILFGDVSGFTDLCEKYSRGKGGSSRLTQVLNSYIGAMVQEIMSHRGDILKFSGDAFVVVWKKTESVPMRDAVHIAIDCGLIIQKTYGTYMTDVDVIIRVKLIISAGPLTISIIGDDSNSHYLEIGQPIWDIKAADGKSLAGDVVVSPSAWQYVSSNEYLFKKLNDDQHVKVLGIGPNWRVITRNSEKTDFRKSKMSEAENEFSLRPAVNYAVAKKMKEKMRKFIIKPVMNALDLQEPLDYLTEVRQVATIMLDIVLETNLQPETFLDVANEAYMIICSIVSNYNGIVNKINFFDKDLMILVIFGLRGFKMESESEISLKCARECRLRLTKLNRVLSVGIGVTTGKTYCGVFGHSLRKEYTVISIMVNKAARLMMAYPDKVTCDRNVYISSKLHPKNFILQEYKSLKGISNPGPVYEFDLVPLSHKTKVAVNRYPILGRDEEVKTYVDLIETAQTFFYVNKRRDTIPKNIQHINMMMIEAKRLIGKGRLMDELIYVTPNTIPIARCNVIPDDKTKNYQTIKLIFLTPLGATENSPQDEIKKKISARLELCPYVEHICCLNDIFEVDFEITPEFSSMSDYNKTILRNKLLKYLAFQIFVIFWVVSISNIHNIDEHSWKALNYLIKFELFFVVATISTELSFFGYKDLPYIYVVTLGGLDKVYHCALACQLMHVDAITPDLEKIVQARSDGNPGWAENFLISLIQSSEIIIKNMTYKEAYNQGLVMPPEHLKKRLTASEKQKSLKRMEADLEGTIRDDYLEWAIYKECYRNRFKDLTEIEAFEQKFRNEKIITVAMVNPNFNSDTLNIELFMDVVMIKTFDSLNSYQQLLVKCSSVLPGHFPRDMLIFVMNTSTSRSTAKAIQTLFEKLVFCCAYGDFLDQNTMQFRGRLVDPTTVTHIKCECRGILIEDFCVDLPKYASCGYLRYRFINFRNIIYNLLTDKQKKEFHSRAIKYLEKETRRCKACGNGFFVGLLGENKKNEWKNIVCDKKKHIIDQRREQTSEHLIEAPVDRESISKGSTSMAGADSLRKSTRHTIWSVGRGSEIIDRLSHDSLLNSGLIGLRTIKMLRKNSKLTKTFSNYDFSECQCHLILTSVYAELVDHCKGAENGDKLMESSLEYAKICIENSNVADAKRALREAMHLLEDTRFTTNYLSWVLNIKRAKIYTLMGNAVVTLGLYNEGHELYATALVYYGCTFPRTKFGAKFKSFVNNLKHKIRYYICSGGGKPENPRKASFHDDLSDCLLHYSKLLFRLSMWKKGELAATWSLTEALRSQLNYTRLCHSFAHMIMINSKKGHKQFSIALETYSLRMMHLKKNINLPEEVKATVVLYRSIFHGRMFRSELEQSMEIGCIAWRLGNTKRLGTMLLNFLPLVMINALYRKMINEAVIILQELEFYVDEDRDITGKMTFFYLCVIMQLETCYTIESFRRVEKFFRSEGYIKDLRDADAKRRLAVVTWLWCVRNENWELANIWEAEAFKFKIKQKHESLSNIICSLYMLEGQILYLVSKIDRRNVARVLTLHTSIETMISILNVIKDFAPVIIPRLTHLKAYYKIVKENDYTALGDLIKARKYALKYENLLELDWTEHTEKAWINTLSQGQINFWKEHTEENILDINESEMFDKTVFFTLPIPVLL